MLYRYRRYLIQCQINPFPLRAAKRQTILLVKGEPLGGKGLTEPICPSLFLNTFPPRAAKSGHFVILLCLTPGNFTHQRRASGWERVKVPGDLWLV